MTPLREYLSPKRLSDEIQARVIGAMALRSKDEDPTTVTTDAVRRFVEELGQGISSRAQVFWDDGDIRVGIAKLSKDGKSSEMVVWSDDKELIKEIVLKMIVQTVDDIQKMEDGPKGIPQSLKLRAIGEVLKRAVERFFPEITTAARERKKKVDQLLKLAGETAPRV